MPIRNLLLCLADRDPYVAPGVQPAALTEIIEALEDIDAPEMPQDFVAFLKEANGFVWEGIEIFGATGIAVESNHSVIPSLPEINDSYANSLSEMRGRLLIGRSEDDLYVYDSRSRAYWILDRHGLEDVASFPCFLDLLSQIVEERR